MEKISAELSYLMERVYEDIGIKNLESDIKEEGEFWKELFGEDFYEIVLLNKKNIMYYLKKQPIVHINLPSFIQNNILFTVQKYESHRLYVADCENFLCEWVDKTISELYRRNQQYSLNKDFYRQAARDLEARLESVYSRVLIAEIHILLEEEQLSGKDPIEKFQHFVKEYISKLEYVHEVMTLYPGLHRAVLEELYQFFMFYQEFIQNYFVAEKQIKKYFGIQEESGIYWARGGISDLHNHGKSVLIIEFTEGERLVYKPRTGANEITFYCILNNLYRQCGLTGREYKVLDQTEYCWCEYLQQEACRDDSQIKKYYKRMGILLFTAYMFGAGDLHEENLIACGEFPMAVDLEVLTRQNVYHASPIDWKIQSSVMYTGILPVFHWGKYGKGIYAGALGDDRSERQLPFQVPVVVDRKSTDMRIVYTSRFHAGRTCCGGAGADFFAYRDEIIEGYQAAYNYAVFAKEELWDMLPNMSGRIKNRILYEDTQKYAMLIHSSFHPDLMLDAADREIYLEKIREGRKTKKEDIIQQEILAMLGRDIPLFYQKADEKAVRINGKIADEALELDSPIETIKKNISALNEADRDWQTYLIRLSMDLYEMNTQDLMNTGLDKKDLQAAAADSCTAPETCIQKIYAQIVGTFIYEGEDIGWIDPKIIGDHWVVQKNNEYFYSGTAGMFFLYHCLMLSSEVQADPKVYAHTKKDFYQVMAKEAVKYENANYDTRRSDWKDFRYAHHTQDVPISWCHGAGGILLLRKNIMKNCTDPELFSVCKSDIDNNIQRVMEYKLRKGMCMCHGTAGNYEIVRACLRSKGITETMRVRDVDEMLLQERIIPGFMTGLGGICYGYLRELHPEWPNVLNLES